MSSSSKIGPQDLRLVRRLPFFASVSADHLARLLQGAMPLHAPRNGTIFLQDEPATAFYVVLDGWIKLSRLTAAGQETVVGVFTNGESFAEAAIFGSGIYPVTAIAVTPARLLHIPAKRFIEALFEDSRLCLSIMGSMSAHLRKLVAQLERLTSGRAVERLSEFLFKLCDPRQSSAELHLPHDKSLVAARLGMQPETLSRCLAKLRQSGVIECDGDLVIVPDVAALRA
jgi:CRP/FNR family transcriptional regulator, dissimilatory nitrate respiration regulator